MLIDKVALRARAEANFKKDARAGVQAGKEYEANGRLVREQMQRLKALRLATEGAKITTPQTRSGARNRRKPSV